MASTRKGRAEVGQLRLSVAVTTPLGPSLLRCLGGLASIADNRLGQSRNGFRVQQLLAWESFCSHTGAKRHRN